MAKYTTEEWIKYGSLGVGGSLFIISVLLLVYMDTAIGLIMLILSAIVSVVPYALYDYIQFSEFKEMEEEFPRFLRDFAESKKSGMTFPQALQACTKTDYGALSKVVNKAAKQISWNVPFEKVILNMSKSVERSQVIKRAFTIIIEASKSGGDVGGVMDTIAMDINTIREMDRERSSLLSQQVMIMYFIFFLFLGIVVLLFRLLIPMIELQSSGGGGGGMFGLSSAGVAASSCASVQWLCSVCPILDFGVGQICYYEALFFSMAIIQAIGTGIIAGKIGTGSAIGGVKHSIVMLVCAVATFVIFG